MHHSTQSLLLWAMNSFLENYSANALARAEARHAANGHDMAASFVFDHDAKRYVVSVMRHVVATFRKISDVREFSMMHNRVY